MTMPTPREALERLCASCSVPHNKAPCNHYGVNDKYLCVNFTPIRSSDAKVSEDAGAPASALNSQHGGDHYKKLGDFQPFIVLSKWMTPEEFKGFAKGTAIVYLAREKDKGGRLDIKKALHILQLYLELSEEGQQK